MIKTIVETQQLYKQEKWKLIKQLQGKCTDCGKDALTNSELCVECGTKRRLKSRERNKFNPKQPGKAGRPIKYI